MTTGDANDKTIEYLDLLTATLTQHEKTLDTLIEKLEKASKNLTISQRTGDAPVISKEAPEVFTYTKIEIPYNRPVEELTKILEALTRSKTRQ
jgi:hypothetical protein